jgi:hypothetical protein
MGCGRVALRGRHGPWRVSRRPTADPRRAPRHRGSYRLVGARRPGAPACTHGPDPAPPGLEARGDRPLPIHHRERANGTIGGVSVAGQVPCFEKADDFRVQLLYARAPTSPTATPPGRHRSSRRRPALTTCSTPAPPRPAARPTCASCTTPRACPSWTGWCCRRRATTPSLDRLRATEPRVHPQRPQEPGVDGNNVFCGWAEFVPDDQPGQTNLSNGVPDVLGLFGRIDLINGTCAGRSFTPNLGRTRSTGLRPQRFSERPRP